MEADSGGPGARRGRVRRRRPSASFRPSALAAFVIVALAVTVAACGASAPSPSTGPTRPTSSTTTSTSVAATTTTSSSSTSTTGPTVAASLPVIVCNATTGVPTTTTSLPASVSVNVPPSNAQQQNLAVYSDASGRLILVGPLTGWTCAGSFGADGSGDIVLAPVNTQVPVQVGTQWHLPSSSPTQAITAVESGGSTVQGAALVCSLFSSAASTAQQSLGKPCPSGPAGEHTAKVSAAEVTFQDPPGVAGIGIPSGGQNPANGVGLYQPKPNEPTAYAATCTLQAAQQALCSAVLNHFVATYG